MDFAIAFSAVEGGMEVTLGTEPFHIHFIVAEQNIQLVADAFQTAALEYKLGR